MEDTKENLQKILAEIDNESYTEINTNNIYNSTYNFNY